MKQQRPEWNDILEKADNQVYYFSLAEVPEGLDVKNIKSFNMEKYLKNFSEVLEVRQINHTQNPVFAMVIAKTNNPEEIKNLLTLNISDYINFN